VIWVYYSAQVLLVGAEFTEAYARRYGSRITPDDKAVPLEKAAPKQQNAPSQAARSGAE
jgi:membrane protein